MEKKSLSFWPKAKTLSCFGLQKCTKNKPDLQTDRQTEENNRTKQKKNFALVFSVFLVIKADLCCTNCKLHSTEFLYFLCFSRVVTGDSTLHKSIYAYSHLLNTSPGRDNSQGREKVENQGLNGSKGWEKSTT